MAPEREPYLNRVIDECESTNDLARALGEGGYPHGSWVSARRQTRGRGRLGRSWLSMPGNLFLSFLVRDLPQALWSWIPLASAVGAARAIRELAPKLELTIKWPNDLWIGAGSRGAKVGGILCEGVGSKSNSFVVVGLGLNCATQPEASSIDQRAARLGIDAELARPLVLKKALETIAELGARGPSGLRADYERWAALPAGTSISWQEGAQGVVLGLGESGELRVRKPDGAEAPLYAEDVKVRPA